MTAVIASSGIRLTTVEDHGPRLGYWEVHRLIVFSKV